MRSRSLLVAFSGVVLLCVLAAAQNPLELNLPPTIVVPNSNGVGIAFRPVYRGLRPAPSAAEIGQLLSPGSEVHGTPYFVALEKVSWKPALGLFVYEFLVWNPGDASSTTSVVYNVGSPGSFKDSWVEDIPVTVRGPSGSGEGRIRLPIHPMEPAQVCKVEGAWVQSSAHAVNLGFESKLPLRLDCSQTSQGVRVIHIDDRKVYNRQYWKTVRVESPFNPSDGRSTVSPSAHFELMTAVLEPQAWPALLSRLQTPPSQKYDDLLAFELRYAVMPAGVELVLPIEIPVVFFPSWWIMTVSVLAGAALAWMICVLLNVFLPEERRRDRRQCLFTLVAGLLLAPVAMLVLFALDRAGCSVTLFTIRVNPYDAVVLVLTGFLVEALVFLRTEWLLGQFEMWTGDLPKRLGLARPLLVATALAFMAAPASLPAMDQRLEIVALASCPDGSIVGLHPWGGIVQFGDHPRSHWRWAGRIDRVITAVEIACGHVRGMETVFVGAVQIKRGWLIQMDLKSGKWRRMQVTPSLPASLTWSPSEDAVYMSSPADRAVYRFDIKNGKDSRWATIYGDRYDSLGSVVMDLPRQRVLVGTAFSGLLYGIQLDKRSQQVLLSGIGVVNSMDIDRQNNLLYIADSGKRTVWVVRLSDSSPKLRPFLEGDDLSSITGVAVDASGNVWTSIFNEAVVRVYAPNGQKVGEFR